MSAEIHLRDQNYNIHSGQTLLEALIELDTIKHWYDGLVESVAMRYKQMDF